MITADEPVRGRDLRSCNTCGALMPAELGNLHEEYHQSERRTHGSLMNSIQGLKLLLESIKRSAPKAKHRRWFS